MNTGSVTPVGSVPQLCFGSVRHERLRPVTTKFEYRVFFLRLPLRSMAQQPSVPRRFFSWNRFNLLSFNEGDHGAGCAGDTSGRMRDLVHWADDLLAREGIHDADGEIWLQTFPRVLGYVFNPVSFWFFHRRDGALRAILVAVNNTFGEQHSYLLDTGDAIPNGKQLGARKVFHVSPFCRIEGGYRFRFFNHAGTVGTISKDGQMQPAASPGTASHPAMHTTARIDHDDASGPLLLTSVSGVCHALDDRSVLRAFFGTPLMTFGVILRIHLQALRLWLRRVPFIKKPPPPGSKLSR